MAIGIGGVVAEFFPEIGQRLGEEERNEADALKRLRQFCQEEDRKSSELWDGSVLRSFMQYIAGYQINEATFSRWKNVAGIRARGKFYGHGAFVLATAIGQLKQEGQRGITSIHVLNRVERINPQIGIHIWGQSVKDDDGQPFIRGRELPDAVYKATGIRRAESFYSRQLPNYGRNEAYSEIEFYKIASAVQRYVRAR